ncbi:MAG: VWA domain-containing protein [Myxococcota bacterium]|nr:VWA domain-containing protein [Myxococcota bacterium]
MNGAAAPLASRGLFGLPDLLAALGIETWLHPGWLWIAMAVALLAVLAGLRSRPPAADWSSMAEARTAGARAVDPLRLLGLLLRAGALLALAAVLAGPVGVHRAPPEPGFGLDVVLVVDASGSMRALDARQAGSALTRLELAREVVSRFAERRAAEGDRVALVVFGEGAFTQCPLTSDGALLAAALERVEAGMAGEATALGDALGLAVKRALGARQGAGPAPGRVAVLLTDGRNNAGALSVAAGSALAADAGLRVHTVAIGTAGEVAMAPARDASSRSPRMERHDVDLETLERIATETGGRFFRATRARDLEAVYAEIDGIERIERPLPPRKRHTDRPEPLLALAGSLLLIEIALGRVLLRRLPS